MIEITEEIKLKIYELYEECINSIEPFHRKLDLFIVPENLAKKIFDETNIDVSGHWVCIDNFGVTHALEHHGNPVSEGKRGQIAVIKEDFIKMLMYFYFLMKYTLRVIPTNLRNHLYNSIKKLKIKFLW